MMKYIIFLLTFFIALPSLASEDPEAIKREIFLENVEMFCLNLDKGQWLSQSSCRKVIIAWEEEKRRVANEIVGDKLEAQRSESVILHNRVKEIEKFSKPIIIPDDVRIQQRLAPVR